MSHYLAARCPKCSKWITVRQCEPDDPTFDPSLFMQLTCPHCGEHCKLTASALEVVPESRLSS